MKNTSIYSSSTRRRKSKRIGYIRSSQATSTERKSQNIAIVNDKGEQLDIEEFSLSIGSRNNELKIEIDLAFVVSSGRFNMSSQTLPNGFNKETKINRLTRI